MLCLKIRNCKKKTKEQAGRNKEDAMRYVGFKQWTAIKIASLSG